ncbi:MAG: hypothetical protein R2792_08220 [Saprospiraceae bacterium]
MLSSMIHWEVNTHVCCGKVVDLEMWDEAGLCPEEKPFENNCSGHDSLQNTPCCKNNSFVFGGLSYLKSFPTEKEKTTPVQSTIALVPQLPPAIQIFSQTFTTLFSRYRPPPLLCLLNNRQAWLQVFRN